MPVSFNSPPRNFFLLGSGAQQALTNFFHTINRAGSDRFTASEVAYSETDQKYLLAGSGKDSNTVSFGWLEKQGYNEASVPPSNVEDWRHVFVDPLTSSPTGTTLNFMKQTTAYGGEIIIGGKTNNIPWIAQYSSNGVQNWVSSSQSGDVEYFGVACVSLTSVIEEFYACGHKTGVGIDPVGFVEKFDNNGYPQWGKSAFHVNGSVKYNAIAANDRGEVVVVGSVTDQAYIQGYVAKLDKDTGEILWDKTINSGRSPALGFNHDVEVNNIYIDGNDQIYVVGTEFADIAPTYKKGFIIKYSAEGNLIWHKTTPSFENHDFLDLWSDTPVEQTVVLSRETFQSTSNSNLSLIKYSKNGDVVFRRRIISDTSFAQPTAGLDGDPSFYYMLFVEEEDSVGANTSKNYTFGKVSASGNGFGAFTYDTNYSSREIDYTVNTNSPSNPIGRLADGSVRNDSSDFISYPYSGLNLLLGDDLATNVAYKKTRHKEKNLFEYSGSPAVRVVDFQKANLLGDVYSGSGDWLDQSGNGNSAEVSDQEPFPNTGAIKLENASSDSFEIPYSSDWILGTEWTIEFYIKTKTRRSDKLIGTRGDSSPNGWEIVYNDGQIGVEQYGDQNTGGQQRTSERVPLRKWTHVAVVNYNGGVKIYYDGVDTGFNWTGSSTSTWPAGGNHVLRIGKPTAFNEAPHVLMSNIHIVKGSALYTSAFSVPAIPLEKTTGTVLLTARGNTMSDDSDSNHSISTNGGATIGSEFFNADYNSTDECWQFNGSSENYMSIPNFNTANNIDFSIEVWWKADSLPSYSSPTSKGYIFDQTPINEGVALRLSTAGDLTTFAYPNIGTISSPSLGGARLVSSGTAVQTGVWYHTVTVFETNKVSMYVNGTLVGTNTGAMNYVAAGVIDQSYPFTIGSGIDSSAARNYEYFDGKIGEFRIYQKVLTAAEVLQNHNATKSKYVSSPTRISPRLTHDVTNNAYLQFYYDFKSRFSYDPSENYIRWSSRMWAEGKCFEFKTDTGTDVDGDYIVLQDGNNKAYKGEIVPFLGEHAIKIKTPGSGVQWNKLRTNFNINFPAGTAARGSLWYKNDTEYPVPAIRMQLQNTVGPSQGAVHTKFLPSADNDGKWHKLDFNLGTTPSTNSYNFVSLYIQAGGASYSEESKIQIAGLHLFRDGSINRYVRTYKNPILRSSTVLNLAGTAAVYNASIVGALPNRSGFMYDLLFDGVDDYLDLGGITLTQTDGWTIECWLKVDDPTTDNTAGTWNYLWEDALGGAPTFESGMYSNDNTDFRFKDNSTAGSELTFTMTPNKWHWICFGVNSSGNMFLMYTNGSGNFTTTTGLASVSGSCRLDYLMTNDSANGGFLTGHLGEVRVYNRALITPEGTVNVNATRRNYGQL